MTQQEAACRSWHRFCAALWEEQQGDTVLLVAHPVTTQVLREFFGHTVYGPSSLKDPYWSENVCNPVTGSVPTVYPDTAIEPFHCVVGYTCVQENGSAGPVQVTGWDMPHTEKGEPGREAES